MKIFWLIMLMMVTVAGPICSADIATPCYSDEESEPDDFDQIEFDNLAHGFAREIINTSEMPQGLIDYISGSNVSDGVAMIKALYRNQALVTHLEDSMGIKIETAILWMLSQVENEATATELFDQLSPGVQLYRGDPLRPETKAYQLPYFRNFVKAFNDGGTEEEKTTLLLHWLTQMADNGFEDDLAPNALRWLSMHGDPGIRQGRGIMAQYIVVGQLVDIITISAGPDGLPYTVLAALLTPTEPLSVTRVAEIMLHDNFYFTQAAEVLRATNDQTDILIISKSQRSAILEEIENRNKTKTEKIQDKLARLENPGA